MSPLTSDGFNNGLNSRDFAVITALVTLSLVKKNLFLSEPVRCASERCVRTGTAHWLVVCSTVCLGYTLAE